MSLFRQVCADKMLAPHKSSLQTSLVGRGSWPGRYLRVAMAGGTAATLHMHEPERDPPGAYAKQPLL